MAPKKLDMENITELVKSDEDFITLKKYDYSLSVLKSKYKDTPIPTKVIALALQLPEEQVEKEYERIVKKLRYLMIPDSNDIE